MPAEGHGTSPHEPWKPARAESQVRIQQVPGKAANSHKHQLGVSSQVQKHILTVQTADTTPKLLKNVLKSH